MWYHCSILSVTILIFVFFFNDTATTEIYTYLHTLSLHDALPIYLPPTTVPESAQVRVRGFTNGEAAEKLGHVVVEYVGIMGSFFDLSLLEGVTVAVDYDAALASIDQGMDGIMPFDSTHTEELQGGQKTCHVRTAGVPKNHIDINTA